MTAPLAWSANLRAIRDRLALATGTIPIVHHTDDAAEAEWLWLELSAAERARVGFAHRTGIRWIRCSCGAPASIEASDGTRHCVACAARRSDVAELAERYHVDGKVSLLDLAAEAKAADG